MSLRSKAKFGFTIIEILVVIAITSLLSGLIVTYSSTGRDQVSLYVEESRLAQTILRAKSLAISTYANVSAPSCGYGFHIDYQGQQYQVFSYNPPVCGGVTSINPAFMIPIDSIRLTTSLIISNSIPGGGSGISDVLFVPPDPKTLIWTVADPATPTSLGDINLATKSGNASVTIGVNAAGQISF
jgi:prepilin-type N-terminal cleavage/methylation domain-containing protein